MSSLFINLLKTDVDEKEKAIIEAHKTFERLFIDLKTEITTCSTIGDVMKIADDRFNRCLIIGEYLSRAHDSAIDEEKEALIRVKLSKLRDIKDEFLDLFRQ